MSLSHVVALYECDHKLRTRLGDVLSAIEAAFHFFIGQPLGRIDKFVQRDPELVGVVREAKQYPPVRALGVIRRRTPPPRIVPTTSYIPNRKESNC